MPISNRLFDNGIRLITEPIATTEAVAIGFWFSSGSRDEREGERGVTHFVEHMLFKGAHSLSSREIARFFDRAGGYVNAFTEREMLCVHCVVPSTCAASAAKTLIDMIYESHFTDESIEKERSVIISEILSTLDDPEETGMDMAIEAMYPGHPFSRPIAGTVRDVESLSSREIRDYYRSLLESMPPVVTVAGRFDEHDVASIIASIRAPCAIYSREAVPRPDSGKPVWNAGSRFPRSAFEQSQLFISYRLPVMTSAREWYALSMLNAMLGETVSSRLYQSVREERGLCYSIGSFFSINRDCGFLTAFAAVPSENTVPTLETMLAEIDRAARDGFTPFEIEDARMHVGGEMQLAAEDSENRMKRLARQWFYDREILDIADSANVIHSVSEGDVALFLAYMGNRENRSLVAYANGKGSREAKKRWK